VREYKVANSEHRANALTDWLEEAESICEVRYDVGILSDGIRPEYLIDLRDLIDLSQKLFYFDQIHLKTDASDCGIGAYLYILRKVVEIRIRFLSHSLAKAQLNWSTPEKECFAI
jgi:hypothetical protein